MERAIYEKQLRKFLDKQLKKVEWFPEWSRHYFDVAAGAVFFILEELVDIEKDKELWHYYNNIWEEEYHPKFVELGALRK
jgi:hypothetical protein